MSCCLAAVFFASAFAADGRVRRAVFAGPWYPADPDELRDMVEQFLNHAKKDPAGGKVTGLIAPHAGYEYSGQVAGYAYKQVKGGDYRAVIVIAPSHRHAFSGVSVYDLGGYETPLGTIPLDMDLVRDLKAADPDIRYVPEAHAQEHSLEIQLPFIQATLPKAGLVPLVMGSQDMDTCRRLADALARVVGDEPVLLVASTDLSHFFPADRAMDMDRLVLDHVEAFDAEGLARDLSQGRCRACGAGPVITVMLAARQLGADKARVLRYAHSGFATGDDSRVVGYMAAAFLDTDGQEPADPKPRAGVDLGLTDAEKAALHRIARRSVQSSGDIEYALEGVEMTGNLNQARGAFVTLTRRGELRGCIGNLSADRPLAETVARMAAAAAFKDPRFPPVAPEEIGELEYEISVLTPFEKITDVGDIKVGKHGLIVQRGYRSGLLLPQVPVEYGWDRQTFLEQTCCKAGLPKDAWKEKDTEIFIFSAEVF